MTAANTANAAAADTPKVLLDVNGIEVIYNHVILVLRACPCRCRKAASWRCWAPTGGQDHDPARHFQPAQGRARRCDQGSYPVPRPAHRELSPAELVKRGVVQVMEGRHCFAHLTIEENLLTGAYTRSMSRGDTAAALERVYQYFPRLKQRRASQAGYTSGGEQQMTAIGRALMANPNMILLDEPSMGLAPQIVEEIFEIVRDLNQRERVSFLLAEQNTNIAALRRLRLHPGKRPRHDGWRRRRPGAERGRQGVLPGHFQRRAQELPRQQVLSPPQALAGLAIPQKAAAGRVPPPATTPQYGTREGAIPCPSFRCPGNTSARATRARADGRPARRHRPRDGALAGHSRAAARRRSPRSIRARALARLPVLRKHELLERQQHSRDDAAAPAGPVKAWRLLGHRLGRGVARVRLARPDL